MKTELFNCLFSDFLEAFEAFNEVRGGEDDVGRALFSQNESEVITYLQKGERLVDLARDVYRRKVSKLSLTAAEKHIFSFQMTECMSMYDLIQRIARTFTRPCLKSMENCDDEYAKLLLDAVSCEGIKVTMAFEDDDFFKKYVRRGACGKSMLPEDERIVRVVFEESGYVPMRIHGTQNIVHKDKDISWKCSYGGFPCIQTVDLGYFFAALIIYVQVMKEVLRLKQLDEAQKEQDIIYCSFQDVLAAYTGRYLAHVLHTFNTVDGFSLGSLSEIFSYPINIGYTDSGDSELLSYLRNFHACIDVQTSPYWQWKKQLAGREPSLGVPRMSDFGMCFLLHPGYTFRFHNFLKNTSDKEHFWGLPKGYLYRNTTRIQDLECMEVFVSLFRIIAQERYLMKQQEDYYKELESNTHAKSYQLKKAIPSKILHEMETSLFNDYFGFVEFDEQTDVEKAKEIALEFKALKDTYLKTVDASTNAIRFRKLGNHKATGLYYPSVKCLCVDIHCPQSLTHEFGHLMDYSLGGLSSCNDFRTIRNSYIEYLYSKMRKDSGFKNSMEKKGKFNLAYYTMPTEIFARSFELYIALVLGVKNSIVRAEFSEVYPTEEAFLQLVASYFNALLGISADNISFAENKNNVAEQPFVAAGHM